LVKRRDTVWSGLSTEGGDLREDGRSVDHFNI
jgi:hypothetical protein